MVGSTREQNGHWKSENSTIVILAWAGPLTGELPTGTLYTTVGSASAGRGCCGCCGGGAAPVFAFLVSASYTCATGTPALIALSALASSSSTIFLNSSNG